MKEFMMIFRNEKDRPPPSPEQLQEMVKAWNNWTGGIAAQNKLVGTNALGFEGQTIDANGIISDGPFAEIKEIVGGYTIVKAENLEEAVQLTDGCPILKIGGTVEVRDVMVFDVS